jgi:hypothetical protein
MGKPIRAYDPKSIRRAMHTHYDRYVSELDMFPRIRFMPETTVEMFPRKTQAIAGALLGVWSGINQDRDYFASTVVLLTDTAKQHCAEAQAWKGLSIVRIGRNAVSMAIVSATDGQQPTAEILYRRRDEFIEEFGGKVLKLGGNEGIKIAEDILEANRDISPVGVVVRDSNVSAIYVASQQQVA